MTWRCTAIAVAIALLAACAAEGDATDARAVAADTKDTREPAALLNVDHPDPDAFKPDVAQSLHHARRRFERDAARADGAQLGEAYGKLGLFYQAHEQQSAAADCYTNAARLQPDNYRWPYYLAVHFEETGSFDQAIAHYRRSLDLNAENVAGATRLGLLYAQTGDTRAADRLLTTVVEVDQDNAAALAGLAGLAVDRDEHRRAAELYEKALGLQPEATQLNYRLGLVYRELGDIERARALLGKRGQRIASIRDPLLVLMQAHATPVSRYLELGHEAREQGDMRRAARFFGLAAAVDPDNAQALTQLGRILLAVNRPAQARQRFARLVAVSPDDPQAHFLLALSQKRLGERDAAIGSLEAALALRPDFEQARETLAELR